MKKSLRAMVSARPPRRIRCLNTSRLHSNYSTVVSHDTTVFLLTKNSCTPAGAQDRFCRLALLYFLPLGSFPILLSAYNQNAATAVPAARRAAEIFCTKARALGPSPWTQTESACRVTVLPSSACTVPCAAICKTRAMAVGKGFHQYAHQRAYRNSNDNRKPCGHPGVDHQRDGVEQRVCADHDKVTVGEVDHADNAVDHCVAQGNQRINCALV